MNKLYIFMNRISIEKLSVKWCAFKLHRNVEPLSERRWWCGRKLKAAQINWICNPRAICVDDNCARFFLVWNFSHHRDTHSLALTSDSYTHNSPVQSHHITKGRYIFIEVARPRHDKHFNIANKMPSLRPFPISIHIYANSHRRFFIYILNFSYVCLYIFLTRLADAQNQLFGVVPAQSSSSSWRTWNHTKHAHITHILLPYK